MQHEQKIEQKQLKKESIIEIALRVREEDGER
jgi:hypothetical protein